MDEKYLKELYDLIGQKDLSFATKMPYDKFIQKMVSDEGYKGRLFGWMKSVDNSFNPEAFESKFKVPQQPPTQQPVDAFKKKGTMVSSSGDGSSGSLYTKPQVAAESSFVARQFKPQFQNPEQLQQQQQIQQRTQFIKPNLDAINADLINSTEEYVVPKMQYQFGDLGFKFEESGATGDWMIVTAPNGQKREFGLDPFMGYGADDKAKELKRWMEKNIATIPEPKIKAIEEKYKQQKKFVSDDEVDNENKKFSIESQKIKQQMDGFLVTKKQIEDEEALLSKVSPIERQTQEYKTKVNNLIAKKQQLYNSYLSLEEKNNSLLLQDAKLKKDIARYTAMKGEQGTWMGAIGNWMIEGITSMGETIPRRVSNITIALTPESVQVKDIQVQKDIIQKAKEKGIKVPEFESQVMQAEEEFKKLQLMPNITVKDREARELQLKKINNLRGGFDKWYYSLPEDQREGLLEFAEDKMKKTALYGRDGNEGILTAMRKSNMDVLGDDATTLEFMKLKEEGFWGKTIAGVAKSLPALVLAKGGGGMAWAQRTSNMFAQTSEGAFREMEGPEFANISENEKTLVAAPIGIVGAVLETFGFRNVIGQKGLLNGLAARALARTGTNTTAKSFARFVREDVESMMARGVLTLTAGGLAEFETGVAQQISDYAIKDVYNIIKNKKDANGNYLKMFNTPESIGDWVKEVAVAGAQEAVGGFILGVPNAVASAYRDVGFKGMDDIDFLTFRIMANDSKMQSAYVNSLKAKILSGEITTEQAKETLNNYRESAGLFRALPTGLSLEAQKEAMNLLRERRDLENSIDGKDAALVTKQKARIEAINKELNNLSENAVQESTTNEGVLRTGQAGMGLSQVGEGNQFTPVTGVRQATLETQKPEVLKTVETTSNALSSLPEDQKAAITFTNQTGEEVSVNTNEAQAAKFYHDAIAVPEDQRTESQQSVVDAVEVSLRTQIEEETAKMREKMEAPSVIVAPFFDTQVTSVQDAETIRQSNEYKGFIDGLNSLATAMGLTPVVADKIGGYVNDAGQDITEVSAVVMLPGATIEQAEQYAALSAALAPNVQESSIAARYVEAGTEGHNANEYEIKVSNVEQAIKLLKQAGIGNFTADDKTGIITFIDTKEFSDDKLDEKVDNFLSLLEQNNISYDEQSFGYREVESRYVSKTSRKKILRQIKEGRTQEGQGGADLRQALDRAIERDAEFQGTTVDQYGRPAAGNRLFNKPLSRVSEIADRYYQRAFGTERPRFKGTRKLDKARAKRISDAFESLKHDPFNPEVRAAYEALAKETIDQYNALLDAGYVVEVNNEEPYGNSDEMINDLRENKRIKIYSTESGFGDTPITEEQRSENPLLARSEFTDKNGVPLLINDLFRAVHDFFGHAELGNSFGPLGEENAWNVHVRMFSPLAARAMTTETRGQNSFVNFSGVNDETKKTREESRQLREEGNFSEASKLSTQIYDETSFAQQKVGLLPIEFSQYDANETGDVGMQGPNISEQAQRAEEVSSKTQEEQQPEQEPATELDALLDEDVKNKDGLDKVLKFLDDLDKGLNSRLFGSANSALLALPLATVQTVVKGLKVLVQGGMALRDAIKQVAADNNLSQPDVQSAIRIVESMAPIEQEYNAVMDKVDKMIARQRARGINPNKIALNVDTLLRKQDVYTNGTDAQRKIMEREGRNRVGVQQRIAPSIGRVLGSLSDFNTITRKEKIAIIREIRNLSKDAAKDLAKEIRSIVRKGKINTRQAANIIARFGKVNLLNERSISSFVDYMSNIFKDAEYENKLKVGRYLRKGISKLSKNKEKNADLRELAKKFAEIDPSMVENIDSYNSMASQIKESLIGSKIRKPDEVREASMVNIQDAMSYVQDALSKQDAKLREEAAAEIQELMGIDASMYSYDEMMAILRDNKPITETDSEVIRETIRNAFESYSDTIREILSTGINPFTGAPFDLTSTQRRIVSAFMEMDLDLLTDKEALKAIDSLKNFIENKSTAGMDAVVNNYLGIKNLAKVISKGISAVQLRKYFSPWLARNLAEQTTNLGPLFERMFKGVTRGGFVEDMMGLTKVKRGKAMAQFVNNAMVKEYVKEFYDKKTNGQAFNSRYNNVERGMYAFLMRNVVGTQSEQETEFKRRKDLIKESIQVLADGNRREQEMSELYKEAYDSMAAEGATLPYQIQDNVSDVNKEAVQWWTDKWSELYPQLSDLSLNIYNKVLEKDTYYTPDRLLKLSTAGARVDLVNRNDDSQFHYNNGTIYQRESSGLMEATRPGALPREISDDGRVGDVERYVDLSFDNNNSNAMYDALVDVNTAAALRQVDAFIQSPDFKKVVPNADDRKLLKQRISHYVRKIRNKAPFADDELTKSIRRLNNLAAIGVGQALGSLSQPLKQMIPVMGNTLVNSGRLDMGAIFDSSKSNFINRSGYGVANRGIESQAQIESINKLIEIAATSPPEKAAKYIMKANDLWLKVFLIKPDAWIARASWLSFYEKSLKRQGIKPSKIDWDTHEVNEEAGNYAQRMLDRQQNISDPDEAGKMFSDSDNAVKTLFTKVIMPFASFRMNQSTRLGNDLSTLGHWSTSTKEDKVIAARSLAGYAVEMLTYRTLSATITLLMGNFANSVMGNDDEEEEDFDKRLGYAIKGQLTGAITDLLSPVPILDKAIQGMVYYPAEMIQDMYEIDKEEQLNVFKPKLDEFFKSLGLLGVTGERAAQFVELVKLSAFDGSFTDNYGKEKFLDEESKEGLKKLIGPSLLSSIGLLPADVNTIVRTSLKNAKRENSSTKEGGKTQSDYNKENIKEYESAERKENIAENREEKVKALKDMLKYDAVPERRAEIIKQIDYLEMTDKQRKLYNQQNTDEDAELKKLLQGYENKTDMKRYNPELYEATFGEYSEYYIKNRVKMDIENSMNEKLRQEKDIEYGYESNKEKRKKWKSQYNAPSRGRSTYIRKDANGNVIYKSTRSWGN